MKKFNKICSVIINILFSFGLIYYTLFNAMGINNKRVWYPKSEFFNSLLDSLFFEEKAIGAVFFFEACLVVAAISTLIFCRKLLPKPVKAMLYCGFALPVILFFANDIIINWNNGSIKIWFTLVTLLYLVYLIVFQIFFWKSKNNAE